MKKLVVMLLMVSIVLAEEYYSQYGQDKFFNEVIFKGKRDGVFLEIGAYDGVLLSNSYFFEKTMGWNGVCVEPIPGVYKELKDNRTCHCLEAAISDYMGVTSLCHVKGTGSLPGVADKYDPKHIAMLSGIVDEYDPRHERRIDTELLAMKGEKTLIDVDVYSFNDLMEMYGLTHVDFVSLDTEGGEEKILRAIDFDKYTIDVFTVEVNYRNKIGPFLHSKGYKWVKRMGCDYVFVRKEFLDSLFS